MGDALLLESFNELEHRPKGPENRKREALDRLIRLYDAWHEAEPDAGYDTQAAHWRTKLPAASQPASPP